MPNCIQYNELMKKKRIVENDKAKILQTIEELDQKKNEALNLAWQKVFFFKIYIYFFIYCIIINHSVSFQMCLSFL